ncbi:hypothetical protein RHMOL_Rhmol10G0172700 [Rhododendron molle]|uniref:Uncharacterized protein n=1 Tax=Rhododendron molle TaxID=49168 RepID=A0ACC0M3E5_RHOML|nr:hypothetical protein RHMOL_Rhmol10G0172700 [Rhododendron molle]
MGFNLSPLQGYALPDHMTHFMKEDLVQEEPRILRERFFASTINRLVNSVMDPEYDPTLNILDEGLPHPVVLYSEEEDCSIMVTDLVPPTDLWDVDEIVDIQVGTEVWAINCSLVDGSLWDVPFITDPEPIVEVAAVKDLSFWDSLLL